MKKQGRREFKYSVGLFRNRNRVCGLDRPQILPPSASAHQTKVQFVKKPLVIPGFAVPTGRTFV